MIAAKTISESPRLQSAYRFVPSPDFLSTILQPALFQIGKCDAFQCGLFGGLLNEEILRFADRSTVKVLASCLLRFGKDAP